MDLDRYYTPPVLASELVAVGVCTAPTARVVADTACGAGNLLLAAEDQLAGSTCIGIDNDRNAIRRLRSRNPKWLLSVANVLDARFPNVRAVTLAPACDLLALNPPFSMSAKSVPASFYGSQTRSSVAMAHVLRSLEIFEPAGGAVAIVPESLLFSEIDAKARALVACRYDACVLRGLRNSTFRGARVNALLVQWTPRTEVENISDIASSPLVSLDPIVTRGGLPLFESRNYRHGLPLVHTTNLARIARTGEFDDCVRVRGITRGVVTGTLLFLPRVGVPLREHIRIVRVDSPVQLSDCVFALAFSSMRRAVRFRRRMLADWAGLVDRYRGTGARYISVARMNEWVHTTAAPLR
jgi:hypothetical protein